jgi:1-acyl-sn-glycerol-3-phosphate acyltransferase
MIKTLCKIILRIGGWTLDDPIPDGTDHCILVAAPHTSNWDFLWTLAAFRVMDIPIRFTIKKEWMRGPVGAIIRRLGGLAIDRQQDRSKADRVSYTDMMADILRQHDRIAMVVTPEGTRSARDEWKLGFYYAAQRAETPVCCGYCDYKTRHIGIAFCYLPSGDLDQDIGRMMDLYSGVTGCNPDNFMLDKRYSN